VFARGGAWHHTAAEAYDLPGRLRVTGLPADPTPDPNPSPSPKQAAGNGSTC